MITLTPRQAAEAIEQFGDDLAALTIAFDKLCDRLPAYVLERVYDMPPIYSTELVDRVAEAFCDLGDSLSRECDAHEEEADRARMVNVGGHRSGGSAA